MSPSHLGVKGCREPSLLGGRDTHEERQGSVWSLTPRPCANQKGAATQLEAAGERRTAGTPEGGGHVARTLALLHRLLQGQVPLPAPPPFQELPLTHTGQAGAWEAGIYGLVVFPCSRERRSPSRPPAGHLGDAAHEGRRCSRRSRKTTRGRLCQRSGSVPVPIPRRPSPADPWGEAPWLPRFLGRPQGPWRPESQTLHPRHEAASALSPRTRKMDAWRAACWPHPQVDPGLPDSRPRGGPVAHGVFGANSSFCCCSLLWWQQDPSWGIPASSAPSLWEMPPEPTRFWSEGPSGGLSAEPENARRMRG